ncbi:MAG TPA: hypothetical protein VFR81_16730 [Longimicrobium sp.]|nr:hypothetical protein [Longimicrobium sp.]
MRRDSAIRPVFRILCWIFGPALMAVTVFLAVTCLRGEVPGAKGPLDCGILRLFAYFLVGLAMTYAAAVGRDPLARLRGGRAASREAESRS